MLGVLYIAAGVFLLLHPLAGLASLTLVLAIYLLVECALELMLSYRLRRWPAANWLIIHGVLTLLLGVMIYMSWPASSEWAIGTLVGISMIFSGITRLALSLSFRKNRLQERYV